jgi:hypothetical protein
MFAWLRRLFGTRPDRAVLAEAAEPADGPVPFTSGQLWSYAHRPGEEGSTVEILRVEREPAFGTIVHVSVHGLRFRNPMAPGGFGNRIGHLPFAEDALRGSVRAVVGQREPDDEGREGYQSWRAAFEQGDAGVFTVSLADVVGMMEAALGDAPQG